MYKLICFDLDDTLWPCMPTIHHAEQAIYDWMAEYKPAITQSYSIDQLRDKRKALLQTRPELINDLSRARVVHLQSLAKEFNDSEDWVDEAFDVFYQARQKVNLFEDVIPVLLDLKQHFILAALTNGNAHIKHTGLSEYFSFQVSASDVLAAKPHPAMFVRAMQQAEVTPQDTLHVGDHPEHDIQGARNAGIDAVWIKRFQQVWDTGQQKPKQQFDDLYQLKHWLMKS